MVQSKFRLNFSISADQPPRFLAVVDQPNFDKFSRNFGPPVRCLPHLFLTHDANALRAHESVAVMHTALLAVLASMHHMM
jgi:hypothetical protein